MSNAIPFRTMAEMRRFVRDLEKTPECDLHEILREYSTDILCEMNGMASAHLRNIIQREIRCTDD